MLTIDQWIVTGVGLALVGLIVWFFWLKTSDGYRADLQGGRQEATITVKGGYAPDTVIVDAGRPVRLSFRRIETSTCSEQVLFPDFNRSATLPVGETVSIDLMPRAPGEYGFECGMGMLKGRLIVRPADNQT